MAEGTFNRQARRSGGERPARFSMPNLSQEDVEILKQEVDHAQSRSYSVSSV